MLKVTGFFKCEVYSCSWTSDRGNLEYKYYGYEGVPADQAKTHHVETRDISLRIIDRGEPEVGTGHTKFKLVTDQQKELDIYASSYGIFPG